jgi:hypothetical protein
LQSNTKICIKEYKGFIWAMLSRNASATEAPVEVWTRHTIGQMLVVFVVVVCNFLNKRRGQNDTLDETLTYIAVTDLATST